ncbi:NAD(P)/FAD-dependent oxidoreductase [Cryobacterium sp. TMT2-15-1]|uniref:NAD(P)/FAD-dependent oxidoreductase n=1 Tax=Cryobacterium sp. TMT2-15-1 TaxID=1259246 RepID=UPI001F544361|nr:NAD(P)/FAD-dependent oxidoreductase [Cryobacterium sp. TMT2-15-1]
MTPEQLELLAARGVRVFTGPVARLVVTHDRLSGVELTDGVVVPRTAVFVRPRFVPNSDLLATLGCDTDAGGWVTHDTTGRTSVAGVRVAGNAADPRTKVITAAGQGSGAAIAINAELVDEDLQRDLAAHRAR